MSARRAIALGAALGALAVVLGAFGAHGLRDRVSPELLQIYETAVRYHFYHAFALILVGLFASVRSGGLDRGRSRAAWLFLVGIVIFSGSLYLMVATRWWWLGAVTPFGGAAFIAGWVCFAIGAWRSES